MVYSCGISLFLPIFSGHNGTPLWCLLILSCLFSAFQRTLAVLIPVCLPSQFSCLIQNLSCFRCQHIHVLLSLALAVWPYRHPLGLLILPDNSRANPKNKSITILPGRRTLPGVFPDAKLLIPASRITVDTTGSVNPIAASVPITAPTAATIPKRKATENRSILTEHPMDL